MDDLKLLHASSRTLILAYQLGFVLFGISFVLGCWFHPVWIMTLCGALYFLVLRWYWYRTYRQARPEAFARLRQSLEEGNFV